MSKIKAAGYCRQWGVSVPRVTIGLTLNDRPRYTEQEIAFIRLMAPYCRPADLGEILDRRMESDIRRMMGRHRIPSRAIQVRPMALEAIKRAHREFLKGQTPNVDILKLWAQRAGGKTAQHRRQWSAGDIEEVVDRVGREPLQTIAHDIGRKRSAVSRMLAELGKSHLIYRFSTTTIAHALSISRQAVSEWCHPRHIITVLTRDGHYRRGPRFDAVREWHCTRGPLVRSWLELCWRVIHIDDVEWLLDNYRFAETNWQELRAEVWEAE